MNGEAGKVSRRTVCGNVGCQEFPHWEKGIYLVTLSCFLVAEGRMASGHVSFSTNCYSY